MTASRTPVDNSAAWRVEADAHNRWLQRCASVFTHQAKLRMIINSSHAGKLGISYYTCCSRRVHGLFWAIGDE